jgi:RNA polymerase sigma factor (sigma-70 family)
MGNSPAPEFDPYVSQCIRSLAARLQRHPALKNQSKDDLFQELAARLWEKREEHDPSRASFHTFADRTLRNHGKNLIKHACRAKRGNGRVDPARDPDGVVIHDGVDDPTRIGVQLDVRDAMSSLPDDLRELANLLTQHTPPEVAKNLGLTRAAFRHRMDRLRRHFGNLDPQQPDDDTTL